MTTFDDRELRELSQTIATAGARLPAEVRSVLSRGALNIKNDARSRVSDHPTWKRLASTINYSMSGNAHFSEAVIGYEDRGQGELAGIAEFGSAKHDPHPALIPAFREESPKFEQAMGAAVVKALNL